MMAHGLTRASAAVMLVLFSGCARDSTRDIRATILDESGEPLPGAILYAEAYDESGTFACVASRSGQAGEVPDKALESLPIAWRRNARIALIAFAPGRSPVIRKDPSRRIETDGVVLAFGAAPGSAGLGDFAFPFPAGTELRATISAPEYAPVREAFRDAIRLLERENGSESVRERQQLDALGQIR